MRATYTQQQINNTTRLARIIGDSNNILILYELINFGPKSFNELKRMTGINQVTLSRKLSALKTEDLVDFERAGKENIYSVTQKCDDFKPLIKNIESLVINNKEEK